MKDILKKAAKHPAFCPVILTWLILLQIVCLLYYAGQKSGFHLDEYSSHTLSNNYYIGSLSNADDYLNQWHGNDYFLSAVTPGEHRFAYDSVYYNQERDVHPPLYYFFLHTVCSFFPNIFSKWLGIALNILFFILTAIALYALSHKLLRNKWLALLPCALWGFSAGAISSVMFLRMYVLMTLFCVLSIYLHCRLAFAERKIHRPLLAIGLCSYFGFMTQYYYLIFAFFVSSLFLLYILVLRKWKTIIYYTLTMLLSILAGVLFYPASIQHLFFGYRAVGAVSNLLYSNLGANLTAFLSIINRDLFASLGKPLLFIVLLLLLAALILKIKASYKDKALSIEVNWFSDKTIRLPITRELVILLGLLPVCLAYIVVIAKISPYLSNRYVFCVYPFIILCVTGLAHYLYERWFRSAKAFIVVILCCTILFSVQTFRKGTVGYLYRETRGTVESILNADANYAVFIRTEESGYRPQAFLLEFMAHKQVYVMDVSSLPSLNEALASIDVDEKIAVYIDNAINQDTAINTILNTTALTSYEDFYQKSDTNVYLFSF